MPFKIPDLVKNLSDGLKTITPSLPNLMECLEQLSEKMMFQDDQRLPNPLVYLEYLEQSSEKMMFQVDEPQNYLEESSENSQFEADLQSWVETEKQNHPGNSQNIHRAQQRILRAFETEATTLNLEGLKLSSLPACIGQLSNLTELHINNNLLTYLPESIGDLTNLTKLIVNHNQLTSLPDSIGQLSNLKSLYIFTNKLTSLPESIGQLSNLKSLYIFNNKLTSLPESIGDLTNLTKLLVNHNQLTSLPDFIGKLSRLKELYVSHNQLSSLPNSIGDLTNLIRLYVDYNQLTALPDSIRQLPKLGYLYVDYNQLTALPDSIRQLPKLGYLKDKKNYIDHLVNNSQKTQEDFEKDVSQFIQTYQHLLAQWSAVTEFGTLPKEIQKSWEDNIKHLPNISSSADPIILLSKFSEAMQAIDLIATQYGLSEGFKDPIQAYIVSSEAQTHVQRAEQLKNSWSHLRHIAQKNNWRLPFTEQQAQATPN